MLFKNLQFIGSSSIIFLILSHVVARAASIEWTTYAEPDYGVIVNYPTDVFQINPKAKAYKHGQSFISKNGEAKLIVTTMFHPNRDGAASVVKQLKRKKVYDDIIMLSLKPFRYELKARLKDRIVIDYGIFSCREHVYNRVRLTYPQAMEKEINQFLPKMRQRMSAGIGAKTPVRKCN